MPWPVRVPWGWNCHATRSTAHVLPYVGNVTNVAEHSVSPNTKQLNANKFRSNKGVKATVVWSFILSSSSPPGGCSRFGSTSCCVAEIPFSAPVRNYICWRVHLCREQFANAFLSSNLLIVPANQRNITNANYTHEQAIYSRPINIRTYQTVPRHIPATIDLELHRRENVKGQFAKLHWHHCRR